MLKLEVRTSSWEVLLCTTIFILSARADYGSSPPPTEGYGVLLSNPEEDHRGLDLPLFTEGYDLSSTSTNYRAATCPVQCHCEKHSASCQNTSNSALELLPSNLIHSLSISASPNVGVFNLSRFSSLSHLSLTSNNLSRVGREFLTSFGSVEHLDLSHNSIASLSTAPFRPLKELRVLDLSYNNITSLSINSFRGLKSLKNLTLKGNHIGSINGKCFREMEHLEYCDLSFNELTVVSSHWFMGTNLRTLNLNNNFLSSLALSKMVHLEMLDASYNHISSVVIDSLPVLSALLLQSNHIYSLDTFILKKVPLLETIDLSKNTFPKLEKKLNDLSSLKLVTLSDLPNLTVLEDDAFVGSKAIEVLVMNNNTKLRELQLEALRGLRNLQVLSLRGNSLSALASKIFDDAENLKDVDISENPWACDCYLQWLKDWPEDKTMAIGNQANTRCAHSSSNLTLYEELHLLNCTPVSIAYTNILNPFKLGSSALLECQATGNPPPSVTWVTPRNYVFHWLKHTNTSFFASHPSAHYRNMSVINDTDTLNHFTVLENGFLHIKKVSRQDGGRYYCFASNPTSNATTSLTLIISHQELLQAKIISILVGVASSIGFMLVMLIFQLTKMIINRWGCCCQETLSPRYKQIRQMLETIEQYRCQQLDWLSNNYTDQVSRIKDNCADQLTKLRDSYSTQVKNLHSITTYGSNQIAGMRDQYLEQVKKVRDYSTGQMQKVRENYMFQRNRIRKFSTGQMLKLRETYQFQQRTLNKILEKFPSLYLDNCRSGTCARTDSIMFDEELPGFDQYIVTDIIPYTFETDSQSSQYYTPEGSVSHTPRNREGSTSSGSDLRRNSEERGNDVRVTIENNDDVTMVRYENNTTSKEDDTRI